ncbi:unnamed protein product [Clonostachys solani]|uniref:Uncharacterized protein n=1 Tax=Clonostachys solani TaxID=160281 RepID=A0A9N9ZH43_9HYPO|nr:unnamed protein product [Clonostachys solani]
MDMKDPNYILVQDFAQDWVTHPDFALGALFNRAKSPRHWMVVSDEILGTSQFRRHHEPPFCGGRLKISVKDIQPDEVDRNRYVQTELFGSLESSHMLIEEFRMQDSLVTRYTPEIFADRLRQEEETSIFFECPNPTLDDILPLYMVTGIKYAKGLEYRILEDKHTSSDSVAVANEVGIDP